MTEEAKTDVKMLGTKEVASRLRIKPKALRSLLRKINGKAAGERYQWKSDDPFLKKLPKLIKEQLGAAVTKAGKQ